MLFELIATFAAGFMAAGVVLIVNLTFKGLLPKWVMPVCAGLAMIGYTIWSEYSWFDRVTNALPGGLEVAASTEDSAFWRPWTYLYPMTERFVAVDSASLQMHPEAPEKRIVTLYFYARWTAPQPVPVAFDCAQGRRALLTEDVTLTETGKVDGADWEQVAEDDAVFAMVCTGLAPTI